jgi:hypothetical protein
MILLQAGQLYLNLCDEVGHTAPKHIKAGIQVALFAAGRPPAYNLMVPSDVSCASHLPPMRPM